MALTSIKVKSALVLLNIDMPRNLFQPSCKNTWGDLACGIDQSIYAQHVTLAVDATPYELPWASATADFILGKIMVENGDGVTRVRSVKRVDIGVSLLLSYPLDFTPVAGTEFVAYPGCPRTLDACTNLYANQDNFRAYPFVPVPETAV